MLLTFHEKVHYVALTMLKSKVTVSFNICSK